MLKSWSYRAYRFVCIAYTERLATNQRQTHEPLALRCFNRDGEEYYYDFKTQRHLEHQPRCQITLPPSCLSARHGAYTLTDCDIYRTALLKLFNRGDGTLVALDSKKYGLMELAKASNLVEWLNQPLIEELGNITNTVAELTLRVVTKRETATKLTEHLLSSAKFTN